MNDAQSDRRAATESINAETEQRLARRLGREVSLLREGLDVSFEFFPPRTEEAERTLWQCIERLAPVAPRFVSVTYGAGGSTRERTHATVKRILEETPLIPAAHLTCVDASREEIDRVVRDYREAGIRHIVALRGDPPRANERFRPHPQGYRNAADLVAGIRAIGDFEVSVAAYPEVHPDAASPQADLDNLKRKIDAGAGRAITQFFFDEGTFLDFVDRVRAAGIGVPVVPGILPVTNFARVVEFAARCGTRIPDWMSHLFEGLDDAPDIRQLVSATVAAEQCVRLRERGVREFHFYTLNRADLTLAICRILGLRAHTEPATGATPALGAEQ